jgi:hypothetical protein
VQELLQQFVPCVDEVWRLQNRQDPDCLHFQKYMEQGHMKGVPNTKQGIYAATPSGLFLASTNTIDPGQMAQMLQRALDRWKTLSKKERLLSEDPKASAGLLQRATFPEDGLALKVYSRDLNRTDLPDDWRGKAWNIDFAWFRKAEVAQLLPKELTKGAAVEWPAALAQRLVRFHLVDNVRGQTDGYEDKEVQEASIKTEIAKVVKGLVHLKFSGSTRATTANAWPAAGAEPPANTRGLQTQILGSGVYDPSKGKFTSLEIVAAGSRWGMTRFNFRENDQKRSGIGFVLKLVEDRPQDRVAPALVFRYGW